MDSPDINSAIYLQPQVLLLANPSPCLRYLVLRDLMHFPKDHPEVIELSASRLKDPIVGELLALQEADGSWSDSDVIGHTAGSRSQVTSQALLRLGYLGFDDRFPAVARGVDYLFSLQNPDGSWPIPVAPQAEAEFKGYSMIPLQTALPLRSLAACGYATDPRAEKAYAWLLAQRLEDGAWPTGTASGVHGGVAGYRKLPHSRWGCRSNTTGALFCLGLHPRLRQGPEAQHALDLLLGRETREKHVLGFELARILGAEPAHGFLTFYARFDLAMILSLCALIGVSPDDPRLADLVGFVNSLKGTYGLWQYPARPQISHWLSFDILRSLSWLNDNTTWLNLEPQTPFQGDTRKPNRY